MRGFETTGFQRLELNVQITIGVPQIIMLVIMAFNIIFAAIHHGQPREPYNGYAVLLAAIIECGLLTWGGFFS